MTRFPLRGLSLLLLIALITVIGACGGGGGGLTTTTSLDQSNAIGAGLDWNQAVRSGSFAVLAVDASERNIDERTRQLAIVVEEGSTGPEVVVSTEDLPASDSLFLHLRYDPTQFDPRYVNQGVDIAGEALVLGVTSPEDYVVVAVAMPELTPTLVGDLEIARVKFNNGVHTPQRVLSTAPTTTVSDLHFVVGAPEVLQWTYASPGDYDQNSEVAAADIQPIALHFMKTTASPDWQAARVADGDSNGEVGSADIVVIAQNYLYRLTAYELQSGEAQTGPFTDEIERDFTTSTIPDGGGFRLFEYQLTSPVEGTWYTVTAMHGTQRAAQYSNAVRYSTTQTFDPPTNLSATTDGTSITLHWTAPTNIIPDSYTIAVDLTSSMNNSMEISSITTTDHTLSTVFSPLNEYYFAVKSKYGSTYSDYSDVYHYEPGGSGTPAPTALSAIQQGSVIHASWTAPTGNTPMHYDLLVADSVSMAGALVAVDDVATTATDLPGLFSVDTEYYLGVKANYSGGQSDYSNIFHYQPGGTGDDTPPAWSDGLPDGGIKSAAGGNESAAIEWWEATDSGSPPVTYLIYYAEHSAGIDWDTHQDTATGTNMVITGLTNDVAYDFAVRARDDSGNTTTNTNFLTATPSTVSTPVDTGVWRDSVLVDDGGALVSQDVGWFTDIEVTEEGTIGVVHHNESGGDLWYSEQIGGSGAWTSTIVTSLGDTGQWPDLEYNPTTGYPCIAYHNVDEASLEYAEYNGTDWEITVVDDTTSDVGSFASLEFHPDNKYPAIAYFDAIGNDTRYAYYNVNNQRWQAEIAFNGSNGGSGLAGSFCDLAFNPVTGFPAIATQDNFTDLGFPMSTSKYVSYTGTGWNAEDAVLGPVSDLGIYTAGWANSLVFNASGIPTIICAELSGAVMVASRAGTWVEYSVGDAGQLAGGNFDRIYTDIEAYNDGVYWLYYYNATGSSSGSLQYGMGILNATQLEGGGNGGFPSLAMTESTMYAAYLDSSGGQLKVARKPISGGTWDIEIAVDGEGGEAVVGERASLVVHPTTGFPMISYYDASNSAQKYADFAIGAWQTETVSNSAYDGGAGGLVVQPDGTAVIGFFSVSTEYTALKTATGSFGNWSIATLFESNIAGGGDAKGNYCAIGAPLSGTGSPGIAYHNTTQHTLEFAQITGIGSAEITTVFGTNDPGRFNSVAYNPANNFAGIAFLARDTGDLHFVQRTGGGEWSPVAVDTGGNVGNRCNLVYGTDTATPWISYYDEDNKRLKVAYIPEGEDWSTSSNWQFVNIAAPAGSTDYGSYSSIAWHPEHNRAAVVFYDATNSKLWYQFIGDPAAPQAAIEIAGTTRKEGTWPSLTFDATTYQPRVAFMDVDNGDLRFVERDAS